MTVKSSSGFTLIEVLVTFLITSVGLLGLAALQINTMNSQFEAIQRAQMTAMVDDMAARIRMNPKAAEAGAYTEGLSEGVGGYYGTLTLLPDCSAPTAVRRDLCDWNRMIAGAARVSEGQNLASPLGARGCIESGRTSGSGEAVIRVSIAWQGMTKSITPSISCGSGQYGGENLRRIIYRDVAVR
ncbi:MAG: type IV pilus modification protein PilV [Luminiphilus sp.]|nr:type IV pilus modification protein PilV [Luminiphilus sp.]